jgi:aryl-alcohol dehydrogenase-like predicted oxidoreductase
MLSETQNSGEELMRKVNRRQFVFQSLAGAGAGVLWAGCDHSSTYGATVGEVKRYASDQVILGNTGIRLSRLAMGSGTSGSNHSSDQVRLGMKAFSDLLCYAYDQGVNFWESADQYGSHEHLNVGMRRVGRERVVILTKTHARTAEQMWADLNRFRKELGTDYIDIVLLHCMIDPEWPKQRQGAMDALAKAREQGIIRAHGVSCHTLEALRVAAKNPWVQVDLARINPIQAHMDADPATVISVLQEMKTVGKGVIGMKILGQGQLVNDVNRAIRHAAQLDCLDAFTIGFTSRSQLDDVTAKMRALSIS